MFKLFGVNSIQIKSEMIQQLGEKPTLFSLTKNLVYKNIEAQMWKKIRTIVRTSSASQYEDHKNILPFFAQG